MSIKYYIDEKKFRVKPNERYIRVNGWVFDTEGEPIEYKVILNLNSKDKVISLSFLSNVFLKFFHIF